MYYKSHSLVWRLFHDLLAHRGDKLFGEIRHLHNLHSFCYSLIVGFVLLFNVTTYAFNADSVYHSIAFAESDTAILSSYSQLGYHFKSTNPDTARYFFEQLICHAKDKELNDDAGHFIADAYIQIASVYQFQGNTSKALSNIQKADSLVQRYEFKDLYAHIENTKGLLLYNQGEFDKAMAQYQKALDCATRVGDTLFMAKVYSNMAIIKFYQGDYEDATDLFKQPVRLAKQLDDSELLAGNLINVGLVYFHLGDMDSSAFYYNEAIAIYYQIGGDDGLLLCYKNLACVYYTQCKFDLALDTYLESLNLASKLGDQNTMSKDYQNIGEVYMRLGDMERALDYSLKAIRIKEQLGDKPTIATSYNSIGALHKARGNYDEAIDYYQQALSIFRSIKHQSGIAKSLSHLAGVYADIDSVSVSFGLYQEALEIYEQIGDDAGLAAELMSLGSLYIKTGEYDLASQHINKSLGINKKVGDEESRAYAYLNLLRIAFAQGRTNDAIVLGEKAMHIAENVNSLPLQYDVTVALAEVYKASGNFSKALEFSEYHQLLSDSIYSIEKNEAMINAEMLWQVERKEAEILILKNKEELSQQILARRKAENRRQRVLLIASVLLLALFVIILILMRTSNRRKHDLLLEKQRVSIISLKMKNIRNRISPHFFFNALSAATLPLNDFPEHREMYDNLIVLLKRSLENAESTVVPLTTELEIVNSFVALQQKKVKGSFEYVCDVNLNDTSTVMIPSMLIQIPIENAIKHGLSLSDNDRKLELHCSEDSHRILLKIKDNGVGRQNSSKKTMGTGTGLKVLMQIITILNAQNKEKIAFKIIDLDEQRDTSTGTLVLVEIPKVFNYQLN